MIDGPGGPIFVEGEDQTHWWARVRGWLGTPFFIVNAGLAAILVVEAEPPNRYEVRLGNARDIRALLFEETGFGGRNEHDDVGYLRQRLHHRRLPRHRHRP